VLAMMALAKVLFSLIEAEVGSAPTQVNDRPAREAPGSR